jgi:hypothetical protein
MLKSILDEAKLLSNDPVNFIHEFFSDLKNEIDLKKEESVAKIEDEYEKIINEVLEVEKECKIKAKNKAIDLEIMVQEIDYTLKKWNESVNQLDFDSKDDEWKSIRFEAAKEIQKLEDEMDKFKDELFLNKKYSFHPRRDSDYFFGYFCAQNYEIGKISLVLNNFSIFDTKMNIKSEKTIIKDLGLIIRSSYIFKELFFSVNFDDDDDDDDDDDNDNDVDDGDDEDGDYFDPVRCVANVELIIKIHQREARKTNFVNYYHKSNDILVSHGRIPGGKTFGTKEDIMNPLNGIYNKETDSILLEAKIKILS